MAITILLVEDDELNREMLIQRLQRKGYDVRVAIDGKDGILFAKAHLPNLILMDLSLPIVDGWTASLQLKSDPVTSHIPIIAISANVIEGSREKALNAGCDEYEAKPVEFSRLIEKIEHCLAQSHKS